MISGRFNLLCSNAPPATATHKPRPGLPEAAILSESGVTSVEGRPHLAGAQGGNVVVSTGSLSLRAERERLGLRASPGTSLPGLQSSQDTWACRAPGACRK